MCNVAVYHAGQGAGADAVRDSLYKAVHSVPHDFKHNEGWVLIALQNAFNHLLYTRSLQEAVIATVASGGDTDTNAAICGALMGALHGREEIPAENGLDPLLNKRASRARGNTAQLAAANPVLPHCSGHRRKTPPPDDLLAGRCHGPG